MNILPNVFISYDEWFLSVRETFENLQFELAVSANKFPFGKLAIELSAADNQLKKERNNPTKGILPCMQKDKLIADYAC